MKKIQVLIVEDEAIVALDVASQLKNLGYNIAGITAYGEDVLPIVSKQVIDLVLLDVRLKGSKTGIEVAKQLKVSNPTRIIFLTAIGNEELHSMVEDCPHYSIIKKPFSSDSLLSGIKESLTSVIAR